MPKIRVGMISYDHIHAEFRSRALKEMANDVEIVAVADSNEARVCEAQRKFGGRLYRDYRELLERSDLDLVLSIPGTTSTRRWFSIRLAPGKRSSARNRWPPTPQTLWK